MRCRNLSVALLFAAFVVTSMTRTGAEAAARYTPEHPFIAGVHPDRRPEGAPVIKTFPKDAAWYERALHGISEPYPYSLKFLEDQGAWFTPFIHPGMTPPYDIRHWHRQKTLAHKKTKKRASHR